MKPFWGFFFACLTTLSGCALQQSDAEVAHGGGEAAPVETTGAGEPPAFHFKSGDLVLGEFDPYSIGGDLFNPCEEISDEEFAELGLHGKRDLGYNPVTQKAGCYFDSGDPHISLGVVATAANRDISTRKGRIVGESGTTDVPGSYSVEPGGSSGDCYAAVDTTRGAIGVNTSSLDPRHSVKQLCELAEGKLNGFYSRRQ